MSEQNRYDFCPKCGAVMRDGVCGSCGYGKINQKLEQGGQKKIQKTRDKKTATIAGAATAGIAVVIMIAALGWLAVFFTIPKEKDPRSEDSWNGDLWSGQPSEEPAESYGFDEGFDGSLVTEDVYASGEYLHGRGMLQGGRPAVELDYPYIPDPEEDFYRELTDAFVYDLSYTVEWKSIEMGPAIPNQKDSYEFPQAEMEDKAVEERINSRIQDMLSVEMEEGKERPSAIYYVTYMSEDILSIVLRLGVRYESDGFIHEFLRSANFDMHTGEEIPPEETMPISLGLCARFWSLCTWQNPGSQEIIDGFESVEALAERFADEDQRFVYYTPVGVELGLNQEEGGWISVTLNREHSLPFYRYFLKGPDYEPDPDYIPSPEDAYYRHLVNAVPAEFMDSVEFTGRSHEDETGRYYFYYPQLTGGRFPNEEEINAKIEALACPVRDQAYIGAPEGVETVSYVTYMDEEVMSVAVGTYTYFFNYEGIWEDFGMLQCITFDLTTGEEIPKDEIIDIDIALARQFQELMAEQEDKNEGAFEVLNINTPEEILKQDLSDDWNNLVFYTPAGIEAGFNRAAYYVTVTIKEEKT